MTNLCVLRLPDVSAHKRHRKKFILLRNSCFLDPGKVSNSCTLMSVHASGFLIYLFEPGPITKQRLVIVMSILLIKGED